MLQLKDTVDPESPGAAVLHPAETEEGVEVAFTPPEAGGSFGSSVACCSPLQTLTPFHVHNPTMQAKVKDYFVFRVSSRLKTSQVITVIVLKSTTAMVFNRPKHHSLHVTLVLHKPLLIRCSYST